jgi:dolichol-phosphate mannosyltransferase
MRIAKFALVGLSGVLVNEGLLWLFTEIAGLYYLISGAIGIEVSIITNFILNERWTFSDRARGGGMLKRFPKFNLVSIVGLVINMAVLFSLTNFLGVHYLISNLFGILCAFLWNYLVNLRWTWGSQGE